MNIIICFDEADTELVALGKLTGRFSFKSWDNGETMVPESALAYLAMEGVPFRVRGPATYERITAIRNPAPVAV